MNEGYKEKEMGLGRGSEHKIETQTSTLTTNEIVEILESNVNGVLFSSENAVDLIENNQGTAVANAIYNFPSNDHESIALHLLSNNYGDALRENIDRFDELDEETLQEIMG